MNQKTARSRRRGARCLLPILVVVIASACGDGPELPPREEPRTEASPQPVLIDAENVQTGDSLAGLQVRSLAIQRVEGSEQDWVGTVDFEGETTLSGRAGPHPADPEVNEICFFPNEAGALPRFRRDERISWLCFTNTAEARRLIDPLPLDADLMVTIADFQYNFSYSDVHNTARLIRAEPVSRVPTADP